LLETEETEDLTRLPDPSVEELNWAAQAEHLEPWSNVDDEDEVSREEALHQADHEDEESIDKEPMDLLDMPFKDLVPKVDDEKTNALRTELASLRRHLVPMHKDICKSGWTSCVARRRANAQILQDIMRRNCHLRHCSVKSLRARCYRHKGKRVCRRKARRQARKLRVGGCNGPKCKKGIKQLRHLSRVYRYLRKVYTRMYIKYAMLLARYYRRKFHTLAKIFITTVSRLRWEALRVKRQNDALSDELAQLRSKHRREVAATAAKHQKMTANLNRIAGEHKVHVKMTTKMIAETRAAIKKEQATKLKLTGEVAKHKAALAKCQKEKNSHLASTAKTNAELKALKEAVPKLAKNLRIATKKLKLSNARVAEMTNLVKRLKDQVKIRRKLLATCRAQTKKHLAARQKIQGAYNNLTRRLKNAIKTHGARTKQFSNTIKALRHKVKALANRCIPDACGVCGGDESSCATRRSRLTCYSVGDPHYRTFDGVSFDYQFDGQFVLAKHAQDFEVQLLQRRCCGGRGYPRLNKGVAMRGGHTVVVVYEAWNMGVALVNGRRIGLPRGRWVRVGPGFIVHHSNWRLIYLRYQHRGQQVTTTVVEQPWGGGPYLSVYVNAPWQWSSGRSMWGLCGDYDSASFNDRVFLSRWWRNKFVVTNSRRDFFKFPGKRALSEVATEAIDMDDDELAEEHKLDQENGVVPLESLQVLDTVANPEKLKVANTKTNRPEKPRATGPKCKTVALKKKFLTFCKAICQGKTVDNCVDDMCHGMTEAEARKTYVRANAAKAKTLKQCMTIDEDNFAAFDVDDLPKAKEGSGTYGVAFYFRPERLRPKATIVEMGPDNGAVGDNKDLVVTVADASCTVKNVLEAGKWTAVGYSTSKAGRLHVIVNGVEKCSKPQEDESEWDGSAWEDDLVLGGSQELAVGDGKLAKVQFAAEHLTTTAVKDLLGAQPVGCHNIDDKEDAGDNDDNTMEELDEQLAKDEASLPPLDLQEDADSAPALA